MPLDAEPYSVATQGGETSRSEVPLPGIRMVSVVLPCLNEEAGVAPTVAEALRGLLLAGVEGEVIVVDNGSTDRSVDVAIAAGATVVRESRRGYGAAITAGFEAARGDVLVMADADCTYDLVNLVALLEPIARGADLVIGNRLEDVESGAMPFLHRYIGTPVISRIIRTAARVPVTDSQSGYRALRRDRLEVLALRSNGMEFASEMLLSAAREGLRIEEVATRYRPRVGESKLNTFSDGWRHLRLLLILNPAFTAIYPGIFCLILGSVLTGVSIVAPLGVDVGSYRWLPIFIGPMLMMVGAEATLLGSLATHHSRRTGVANAKSDFLDRRQSIDVLLRWFALAAVTGVIVDSALLLLWLLQASDPAYLGFAGFAQALIVIGVNGVVTILATQLARDSLAK